MWIAPLHTPEPIAKYYLPYLAYSFLWILVAILLGRYKVPLKEQGYISSVYKVLNTTVFVYAVSFSVIYFTEANYSVLVFLIISLCIFSYSFIMQTLYFAVLYASDPEDDIRPVEKRGPKSLVTKPEKISEEAYQTRKDAMVKWMGEQAFKFMEENVGIDMNTTKVLATTELFNIEETTPYQYDTIINVRSLNNIRGINKMFSTINEKLPDDGIFIGCFKQKSVTKKEILSKYPKGINWIVYTFYYIIKRIIPKLFLTKRLYYDITKGKRRVLSKTEVYGRLYYCGFEIVDEKKIDRYTYFKARRIKEPPMNKKRRYGPIISLNRVGKNSRVFKFYKMRTMYPYSEFLQEYIYKKCGLQEGGKFTHDIRVSTAGRLMRKYWIDEFPMFINLFKGDMKLVGVRPLSKHYFSLYCEELQNLRVQFKPGLLPPFYADMPKTLDEIQESELKYLRMCQKRGCFVTDVIYIWKIFVNIIFKRARSH
jgi:lipopolysaccharide/colanic/teichoic acid biosynthesis glycosyltransferase